MDEEKGVAIEKKVKLGSKVASRMLEIEKLTRNMALEEEDKKDKANFVLGVCNDNNFSKLILDDEAEQLLVAIKITKEVKKWNDEFIIKSLSKELKTKVVKTKTRTVTTEVIDYEELEELHKTKKITDEEYLSMFTESKSSYVQIKRVKRGNES